MSYKSLAFSVILLPLFFGGWFAPSGAEGFFNYAEAQGAASPDLVIDNVSLNNDRLTFRIRNTGQGANQGNVGANFQWLDENHNPVGPQNTSASNTGLYVLPANGELSFTRLSDSNIAPYNPYIWENVPGGARFLRITINRAPGANPETSTTNNSVEVTRLLPDLVVDNVSFDATRKPTVAVRNSGAVPAIITSGPDQYNHYRHSNINLRWLNTQHEVVGELVVHMNAAEARAELAAGATLSRTPTVNFIPPSSAVALRVFIDGSDNGSTGIVTESNEGNNERIEPFPLPDLVVDNVSFDATRKPTVAVRNSGAVPALITTDPDQYGRAHHSRVNLRWLDGQRNVVGELVLNMGTTDVRTELVSGATLSRTPSIAFTPPSGAVSLRVLLDEGSGGLTALTVGESNEGNNEWVGPFITEDTTGEQLTTHDEEAVARDVADETGPTARILPGNPLYIFKNLGRELRAAATLDPQKDAELRLRYASEKILEANILVDRGQAERAAGHLQSYARDIEKVNQFTARLEERDREAAQKIAERAATNELKHQVLIGKVEREAPAESTGEVKEARTKTLEEIAKTIERLDSSQKVERILGDSLRSDGSPFRSLRNLEVLKAVEEKVPDVAKDSIRRAQENTLKRFSNQLEALPGEHKKLLSGYVEKAGGDEVLYVKAFDDLKHAGVKEDVTDEIAKSREKLFEKIEKRIEDAVKKDPALVKEVFTHLRDGKSFDDLRTLKDIERSVSPETAKHLGEVKKEAMEEFEKKDIKFIEEESKRYGDVKQIAVLEDLKSGALGKKEIEKVKELISQDIVSKLGKVKNESERKEFLEKVSDDSPEAIIIVIGFKDSGVKETLLRAHVDKVGKSIDATQNPEKAERIRQALAEKNTKETVERIQPDIFVKVESKTEIGQLRSQCVDRLNKLRVDVDSLYEELFGGGFGEFRPLNLVINTNVSSLNALRHLNRTNQALQKSFERLASGLRENTAADDAVGLAVRDRLVSRVNAFDISINSANDQISVTQNSDGAFSEIANIIRRMRELAVQSRNGALAANDRTALDREYQELREEVDELDGGIESNREEILSALRTHDIRVKLDSVPSAEKAVINAENLLRFVENARKKVSDRAKEVIRPCEEEKELRSLLEEIKAHRKAVKVAPKKEELRKEEFKKGGVLQPVAPAAEKEAPIFCTREYKLVCGVDGYTYTNRCVAEAEHKVKVAYEGECKPQEAKPAPVSEPTKTLEPVTGGCTREYVPVCGVNGLTYQNICFAKDANVAVQYSGVCKAAAPTTTTEPTKTETTTTTACTKEYVPVCGTNNSTYTNSCFAKQAGVGVQYSGECKATTTTTPTEPAKTETTITTTCTKEYVPVCGTDNRTYDNSCLAKQSGVGVQYSGQCKTTTTTTTSDTTTTKTADTTTTQTTTTAPAKPVINSFCCSATVVSGSKVTLKWDVSGADGGVFLNGSKVVNPGSTIVAPLKTTIYTLSAKNSAGVEVSSSVTITVK